MKQVFFFIIFINPALRTPAWYRHLIITRPYQRGGGGSHVPHLNFKTSRVSVYKCLSLIVGFAITVTIWPREVVSCRNFILRAVATFWAMSLVEIYLGRASITDSLLCPWEKKAVTFSLNSTRLIRTLSVALSVFILTGFDCILVFIKVFS